MLLQEGFTPTLLRRQSSQRWRQSPVASGWWHLGYVGPGPARRNRCSKCYQVQSRRTRLVDAPRHCDVVGWAIERTRRHPGTSGKRDRNSERAGIGPTPVVPVEDQGRRPLCAQQDGRIRLRGLEFVHVEANAPTSHERDWRPNVHDASVIRYVDDDDRPFD